MKLCEFPFISSIYLNSGQFYCLFNVWSYNTSNACNPLHWTSILTISSIIEKTISDFHRSQNGIITLLLQYLRVRITAFVSIVILFEHAAVQCSRYKHSESEFNLMYDWHIKCAPITKETKPKYFLFPYIFRLYFRIDYPSLSILLVWSLREISSILKRFLV